MSYFSHLNVNYSDGAQLDSFARLRTSQPFTAFDSQMTLNDQPFLWETALTGAGTATHTPAKASVAMTTTIASGDKVIRQSRQYIRYLPGKSQLAFMTGNFGAGHANCRKRIGYFDDNNGLFFEEINGVLFVVLRSKVTGSVVDTAIAQASWNLDKMDGSGPSGITIDPNAAQIFAIDFQWLGVGRVRMGVIVDGIIYYVHKFIHANVADAVYMSSPHLPIRYEIENTGAIASPLTLTQICSTVISEGGYEHTGYSFSASTQITSKAVTTTLQPIISIRPKLTFNGVANRGLVVPLEQSLVSETEIILYEIYRNATLNGSPGPSWTSVNSNSIVEYDVSAESLIGGEVVDSGYIAATGGFFGQPSEALDHLISKIILTLNIAGTDSIEYTIAARSVTGTTAVRAALAWKEFY